METTKKYFIEDKDEFLKLRASWKNFVNSGGQPSAVHHLAYNAIRSVSPFRGFSKGTNLGRINAKEFGEWHGYLKAFDQLHRISKYDLKRSAAEVLKPFSIEDENECLKLAKKMFEEIQKVPLPE